MNKIIVGVILICLFSSNIALCQPEKFLKLNRIITIDSSKRGIQLSTNFTYFTLTVPDNVYWKINYISFALSSLAASKIKINNSYILDSVSNPAEKTSPIWLAPNSILSFQSGYYYNPSFPQGLTSNPTIYVSGEEYFIEQ